MATAPAEPTDYGYCVDCDVRIETQDAANAHMDETNPGDGQHSHAIHIVNPTPQQRADSRVGLEVEYAMNECFERLENLIGPDLEREDVTEALKWYSDFSDGWDDWCREAKE